MAILLIITDKRNEIVGGRLFYQKDYHDYNTMVSAAKKRGNDYNEERFSYVIVDSNVIR
ncbi:unnamed protein product [marine sediment metagenome]|uniref:Uncharacterized protein n=1 Tax=marine sediment metagenome TaxID=412755 RepID=X1GDI2_9ZZZZ